MASAGNSGDRHQSIRMAGLMAEPQYGKLCGLAAAGGMLNLAIHISFANRRALDQIVVMRKSKTVKPRDHLGFRTRTGSMEEHIEMRRSRFMVVESFVHRRPFLVRKRTYLYGIPQDRTRQKQ